VDDCGREAVALYRDVFLNGISGITIDHCLPIVGSGCLLEYI
jgi:hypothetical protein